MRVKRNGLSFHPSSFILLRKRLGVARAALVVRVLARSLFEVEGGFAESRGQPVEEDSRLAPLACPARAVEHRERHRQSVVLARAAPRELELPVETVYQRYRLGGRIHVLEAELSREE